MFIMMKVCSYIISPLVIYQACIGLEVHAQIQIRSKLFSGGSAEVVQYGKPNTQVALLDAALPGTLPMINKEAVLQTVSCLLTQLIGSRLLMSGRHCYHCVFPYPHIILRSSHFSRPCLHPLHSSTGSHRYSVGM